MGIIRKILAKGTFNGKPFFHDQLRIESAEAVHIHWRDIRLLATPRQFTGFCANIEIAHRRWDGDTSEEDSVLSTWEIPDGTLFKDEIAIEEQENGVIHFHYQDARIEMTPRRFLMMAELFEQAKKEFEIEIPMDQIEPYDPGHFPDEESWRAYDRENPDRTDNYDYHMEGINKILVGLSLGKRIRPIAVKEGNPKYERLDGFKRYMAYKALNHTTIPCYVMNSWHGCQDGLSWFLEDSL